MLDSLSLKVVECLSTYFIHSLVFLSSVYLLKKVGLLKKPVIAEFVWRLGLFGPLLTTVVLVLINPFIQTKFNNNISTYHPAPNSTARTSANKTISAPEFVPAISQAQLRSSLSTKLSSNEMIKPKQELASTSTSSPSFLVPLEYRSTLSLLAFAWLGFSLFSVIQYLVQIRKLNRQVQQLENCPSHYFENFISKSFPALSDRISIRKAQTWSSPIVAPNHIICLPEWVLQSLSHRQIEVMLAHEIAHIQRNDPRWAIFYQLMNRLFFFQPMNFIAVRELNALAELACDHVAGKADQDRKILAEALYACAQVQAHHAVPGFALAMAKTRSPLVHRVQALLDESQTSLRFSQYQANWFVVLLGATVSLLLMMAMLPRTKLNFEAIKSVSALIRSEVLERTAAPKPATTVAPTNESNSSVEIEPSKPTATEATPSTTPLALTPSETMAAPEPINTNALTEVHFDTISEKWTIEEAKQALNAKRYSQAIDILRRLAESGDTRAQGMLAEIFWFGEGIPSNHEEAEKWFRLAASNGDSKAQSFLNLIAERKQRKQEISFYSGEGKTTEFRYLSGKCATPTYSESLFASNTSQLEAFYKCSKAHFDALKKAKELDQLIVPANLLRILTDTEIKKAESNSALVIEHAIENIKQHRIDAQADLQAWMDAHPNLITNRFLPTPKIPEPENRPADPRLTIPQILPKNPQP